MSGITFGIIKLARPNFVVSYELEATFLFAVLSGTG
jgi:hypothetical protein